MGFGDPESPQVALGRAGTIHGVKGQEDDAVLIVVPPLGKDKEDDRSDRLIEAWTTGATAGCAPGTPEALRVLYVGVTRARRLVALALSDGHLAAVKSLLTARGIPHRIPQEAGGEQITLPL
ncbi:hypothetical protein [Streptomyces sp. NPDC017890]|uniref:hypothetical protein n=1 Tax=Streptomyces sp. NPDC017890 TaxID=3365015 RepID=UPI0037AD748A